MNINIYFKILLLTVFLLILTVFETFSQNVNYGAAKTVALSVLSNQTNKSEEHIELSMVYKNNNDTLLFIFNCNNSFAIISGDYSVIPVLAYSDEGKFDKDSLPPSLVYWLNGYAQQIKLLKEEKKYGKENPLWNQYLSGTIEKSNKDYKSMVKPLITSLWDQGAYYNYYCPLWTGSPYDGRCPTGCVATAMGMIMKYYNHPISGTGSFSYKHPHFGVLGVDFSKETFDWDKMTISANAKSKEAISKLLYDCGVSVSMNYNPLESGSNVYNAATAFVKYFNYRNTVSVENRNDEKYRTPWKWKRMLTDNLIEGHPILYAGDDASVGGHAFICDGFKDTVYFHFNWGWSGKANGYFSLDNLNTGNGNFVNNQQAVINIIPYFAPYCMSKRVYTDSTRTIGDGSAYSNYWNNTKCDWLISPPYAKMLNLKFTGFSTEADKDIVSIYDGDTTTAPLIGTFSGSNIPSKITANSGKMLITFSSNDNNQGAGWEAVYHTIHTTNEPNLLFPANNSTDEPCSLTLKWSPVVTEKYNYKIQIDTVKMNNNRNFISVVNATSYKISNLVFGKTYYWRIKTLNRHNNDTSSWSETFSFKTLKSPVLINPKNKAASLSLPVEFRWNAISGTSKFNFEADITPYFNSPFLTKFDYNITPDNKVVYIGDTLQNLMNGKTYFWRVKARNNVAVSEWSEVRSFSIMRNINDCPLLVSPLDLSKETTPGILLQWNPLQDAISYTLEFKDETLADSKKISYTAYTAGYNVVKLNYAHTYNWRVRAANKSNISSWSDLYTFTVAAFPKLITPLDNSIGNNINKLTLKCDSLTGSANYEFLIDTTIAFNSSLKNDIITKTNNTTLNNLNYYTTYYWKARAMHSADTSAWSSVYSFKTISSHPLAPELVIPANNSVDLALSVALSWRAVNSAKSYIIEIDTLESFINKHSIISNKATYTVNDLLYDKQYFWRVKAKTASDSSAWSDVYSFITLGNIVNKPRLFSPLNGSDSQMPDLSLQWNKINQADKYILLIDTNQQFAYSKPDSLSANSFKPSKLMFGGKYYWKIKAVSSSETTGYSDVFNFKIIAKPEIVSPADNSEEQPAGNLSLKWNIISGITNYQCQVDSSPNFNSNVLRTIDIYSNTYNLTKLNYSTKYYWRIRCIASYDTSQWSNVFSFSTITKVHILKPSFFSVNNRAAIDFSFLPFDNASEYYYRLDTTMNFNSNLFLQGSTYGLTEYRICPLNFGAKYYLQIKAANDYSVSEWSEPVTYAVENSFELIAPADKSPKQMPSPTLSWDNIIGAFQYNYEIDTSREFNSSNIFRGNCKNNIFTIPYSLKFGTLYYWRVQALNSFSNKSVISDVKTFITLDTVVTTAPANNYSLGSKTKVLFSWNALNGISYYQLQNDTTIDFKTALDIMIDSNTSSITLDGFKPGTNYYWRIRALSNYPDTSCWTKLRLISSVNKINNSEYFQIFPNPAKNTLTLSTAFNKTDKPIINIYTLTGNLVLSKQIPVKSDKYYNLDISSLNAGAYFVELINENNTLYHKLIKQ